MARVTSVVGQIRSSTRALTVASISPHAWLGRPNDTRCRVLPSFPTALPSRSSSSAIRALLDTMSLNASAILPLRPDHSTGSRTEKLPLRTCWSARSSVGSTSELSAEPSSGVVTTRSRRFAIVMPLRGAWRGDRASRGLGFEHELDRVLRAGLAEEDPPEGINGLGADLKPAGDLAGGAALGDQQEDLPLAGGQSLVSWQRLARRSHDSGPCKTRAGR